MGGGGHFDLCQQAETPLFADTLVHVQNTSSLDIHTQKYFDGESEITKQKQKKNDKKKTLVVFLNLLILELNLVELQGSYLRLQFRHAVFSCSSNSEKTQLTPQSST